MDFTDKPGIEELCMDYIHTIESWDILFRSRDLFYGRASLSAGPVA
jgi:hypothetical protein